MSEVLEKDLFIRGIGLELDWSDTFIRDSRHREREHGTVAGDAG